MMSEHPISSAVGQHVGHKSNLGFACPLTLISIYLFGVRHSGQMTVIQVMVNIITVIMVVISMTQLILELRSHH